MMSEISSAFNLLNIPDKADFMFFHLARRCLDSKTREDFELNNKVMYPTFDSLIQYLRSRCTASELATGLSQLTLAQDVSHGRQPQSRPVRKWTGPRVALLGSTRQPNIFSSNVSPRSVGSGSHSVQAFSPPSLKPKCYVCGEPHSLSNCLRFATATVKERLKMLQTWRGCRNCLQTGHGTARCVSSYRCRFCRGRHHSLLHAAVPVSGEGSSKTPPSAPATSQHASDKSAVFPSSSLNSVLPGQLEVMLGTALCSIDDNHGHKHTIRLVIDSGSHLSFISRTFAERLGLTIETHSAGIWGIGETPLPGFKGRASCKLSPLNSQHPRLSTNAIVLDVITSPLPGFSLSSEFWKPYSAYPLADPEFWVTRPVDLLIGCDLFSDIVTGEIITLSPLKPRLLGTIFGYSVLGRVKEISAVSSITSLYTSPATPVDPLDNELRRFWELEEPPVIHVRDPEEVQCEEWFKDTTYRLPTGRYVVRLPFRIPDLQFPGSRSIAVRRLNHLEAKLDRNPLIKAKYHEFMSDYLTLGHMELASTPGRCFIPHHCVVKGNGADIKLRVVFDAAAKSASGSLNEFLSLGPKLQTNSTLILLSFRIHAIVFTADAVKMYRQILLHPEDRVYQHILWRFDPSAAVSEYQLNTVSYGQSCAPYLALRVLHQLVVDEGHAYPLASAALRNDTYIDDVATGAASVDEALQLLQQLIELMGKGGFTLSKWASNHPRLLAFCQNLDPMGTLPIGEGVVLGAVPENNTISILGMQWNPGEDCFSYRILVPQDVYTKRAVLSAIAKIYDPLGYLGPTVILAKKMIQEAWKRRLAWDEEFPSDLKQKWMSFIYDLPILRDIKIPRWIVPPQGPYSLLIFADASEEAYCAAAYLRSVTSDGPRLHLILAKTKLAPVKFTTVPRLELCAALLAAKLWHSLEPFIKRLPSLPDVNFFSDSTVVLTWLRTPYHLLKTFVANRVVQIRDLTTAGEWRHVSSTDNPSDLGSRGISARDLLHSPLWFSGPSWALADPSAWPACIVQDSPNTPELKSLLPGTSTLVAVKSNTPTLIDWMHRFSSYSRLIHSLSYVLRFVDRIKGSPPEPSLVISLSEIRRATRVAVKLVQRHAFFDNQLPTANSIPKTLISLSAFLSEDMILMVGGRLKHSPLTWEAKHPIILPANSHLSKLILEHYHRALLHPGSTLLLAALRSKWWILGARTAVRSVTKKCLLCRKFDAPPAQPIMADLPASRFREGRAFIHVGIDFAGPFMVRESLKRKAPSTKAYLCLMVCLSTKALHLEIVSSMSTPAFLAALDRFIGRRGLPSKILSDNGSNFLGASNQLRDFYKWYQRDSTQRDLQAYALQKEVEWAFIPPHAPSFGGIWEAGVKSVKRLMRTVYGENALTFEELATLFAKIESILNSRPLCPLSADPNDIEYLSPGNFLIGSPLLAVPEPSLLDLNENRLSRWQLVAQKAQHFWRRWRREYLNTLQERSKWRQPSPNLSIGDLVLLTEEGAPRMHWPAGRIHNVFPGQDGVVRVVEVKTARSLLKRPVNKIVPLFFESTIPSNP